MESAATIESLQDTFARWEQAERVARAQAKRAARVALHGGFSRGGVKSTILATAQDLDQWHTVQLAGMVAAVKYKAAI